MGKLLDAYKRAGADVTLELIAVAEDAASIDFVPAEHPTWKPVRVPRNIIADLPPFYTVGGGEVLAVVLPLWKARELGHQNEA